MPERSRPLVASVVVETVTMLENAGAMRAAEALGGTLSALANQSVPDESREAIVVLDPRIGVDQEHELAHAHPSVRLIRCQASNYCAAKNAGARAARGKIIAMTDSDCVAERDWLEQLLSRFRPEVAVVAGSTRYAEGTRMASTWSVFGFGQIHASADGSASGLLANNVAFRREVILDHPFNERVDRHGGCYLLFHQLRRAGLTVLHEPGARTVHGAADVRGLRAIRTQFRRGRDGVNAYRLDDARVLRGTSVFRRFGVPGLLVITLHRVAHDWWRLCRTRRQIGITGASIPVHAVVAAAMRGVELTGMLVAALGPESGAARVASTASYR